MVRELNTARCSVVLDCRCANQHGTEVISGTAEVIAPTEKVRRQRVALPEISVVHHAAYTTLLRRAAGLPPVPTAIVHPCDRDSLQGAMEAAAAGFIDPILVGPEAKIRAVAEAGGLDLASIRSSTPSIPMPPPRSPSRLARDGKVKALMKGSLHTDELMHEVMQRESRMRTARRISHAYIMLLASSAGR